MIGIARESGVGVVLGSRQLRFHAGMPASRVLLLRAGALYTRVTTRLPVADTHCGLRVLRKDAAEALQLRQPGMAHASELLQLIAKRHISYLEVPVDVLYTSYSLRKGQSAINGVNILFDLALSKLGAVK
jgi:hypothetical protein